MKGYDLKKRNLLGIKIHDCILQDLINFLDQQIIKNVKTIVYGFSVTTLGRLKEIPEFISFNQRADITIADGAGIPILAKLFGVHIREHIGLPNVTEEMIRLANENNYKVLLFGATQDINYKANENLKKKFPNIKLCRGINGYFSEDDEDDIVKEINKEEPDILLIGISSPIKERFALKYKNRLKTKVIVPCGGMIDIFAGISKREPNIIKGLPLSWIYRFIQES